VAALLLVAVMAYALYPRSSSQGDKKQITNTEQTGEETTSKSDKEDAATNSSEDVDTQTTTNEVPESTRVSTSITSLEQKDDYVEYQAIVSGTDAATCNATFTSKLGKPVVRTSKVSNGVCSEKISAAAFDALGEWQLQLRVYSDNTQATDTQTVTIQ